MHGELGQRAHHGARLVVPSGREVDRQQNRCASPRGEDGLEQAVIVGRRARVQIDVEEDAARLRAIEMLQKLRKVPARPGPFAQRLEALRVDLDDDDVRLDLVGERAGARLRHDALERGEHAALVQREPCGEDERRAQRRIEHKAAARHVGQSRPPSRLPRPRSRSTSTMSSRLPPPSLPPSPTSIDASRPPGSVTSAPRPASGPRDRGRRRRLRRPGRPGRDPRPLRRRSGRGRHRGRHRVRSRRDRDPRRGCR